ncbi:MAG: hypothetical protein KDA39_08130, partial [Hyphomonas sp.]|nr:hypothetical protein [Hyphomonas sp.]
MTIRAWFVAPLAALVLSAAAPAFAEPEKTDPPKEAEAKPIPDPVMFESQHTGTFGGTKIAYTVESGETYVRNKDGDPAASLFT